MTEVPPAHTHPVHKTYSTQSIVWHRWDIPVVTHIFILLFFKSKLVFATTNSMRSIEIKNCARCWLFWSAMKKAITLKNQHRGSGGRLLALAFTLGFLAGGFFSVLEMQWLPDTIATLKIKCVPKLSVFGKILHFASTSCRASILTASGAAQSTLLSAIAKLRDRKSLEEGNIYIFIYYFYSKNVRNSYVDFEISTEIKNFVLDHDHFG